jgi:Spy/CpxP family protein refolding chaperone
MMNRILGFASLGLAVLALAVSLSGSREAPAAPPPTEPPVSTASQEVQALEKRVKALEDTVVLLSSRVMVLERQPGAPAGSTGGTAGTTPVALAQEVEQLKTEVRSLIAGEALNSQGGREYLKEAVRSVQDEMRTAQRQERQQQWAQAQTQGQTERSERIRKFVTEAGLNYSQEQELTRRLQEEETRRQALLDEVRAGSKSPRDIRQETRTLRTQTDEAMQQILTPEQKAKYDELRREDRGPMRQGGWQQDGQGDRQPRP